MWRCLGTRTDTEQRFKERQSLKGHCHAIWQLNKKLEGVFASNSRTIDLVLLLKTIFKVLKLFPVACRYTDGMDGNGLKLRRNWPIFSSFDATCSKTPQEIYYG